MRIHLRLLFALLWLGLQGFAAACIWDGDTLADEKKARPAMTEAILGKTPNLGDPTKLQQRITELKAKPRDKDPAWWNDLAGAYIRLGEPRQAVALLQTNVTRFPNDYGIHANLGTAYHLLGRYKEAEKEIARDLEINPDAHFGLEKYHLALLQYLTRSTNYQFRHVFVDEFSSSFAESISLPPFFLPPPEEGLRATNHSNNPKKLKQLEQAFAGSKPLKSVKIDGDNSSSIREMAELDEPPKYRQKWNLAANTNLLAGVIYMASLNPKQPACFVMLGLLSQQSQDLNLAAAAFEKAIALGSPQENLLHSKVAGIKGHIQEAQKHSGVPAKTEAIPPPLKSQKR